MINQEGPIAEAAKLVAFSERPQVAEVRLRRDGRVGLSQFVA